MKFYLYDTLNFVSKLTPRRVWNFAKVLSSYQLTRWLRRPIQWGLPVTISVEPTTKVTIP